MGLLSLIIGFITAIVLGLLAWAGMFMVTPEEA
jgi:hypothetical protein